MTISPRTYRPGIRPTAYLWAIRRLGELVRLPVRFSAASEIAINPYPSPRRTGRAGRGAFICYVAAAETLLGLVPV